jgi:two-component system chemotaxis sensor kinase CheA
MDMRLIPLKKVVGKFPRLVRDLARELDKDIQFEIEGEDIELDRTILTEISDPLMHILRNAVDHGIESPEEREQAGKPRTGHITLRASRERDHVIIEVEDDGAGLDVKGIREKAIEKGVRSPEELDAMDDSSIYDLVFHPGFSTADEVTDTSGRGVGMDVVHDTVSQLDGSVNVDSEPGEGTTVSLRLPVTMAIVKVLFVKVGGEEYGVPIKNVDEITGTEEAKQVNGQEVIKHNDEIYPVIHLDDTFDIEGETANGDGMLVRIRESERQVALHCDSVNSQEEVVVKPLEGILSGTPGLSGTAVLGDGNIVHILDVVTL